MNFAQVPQLVCCGVQLTAGAWLLMRRPSRPAVWAAVGLIALSLYAAGLTVAPAVGMNQDWRNPRWQASAVVADGFLVVLFAAILVDRRRGVSGG